VKRIHCFGGVPPCIRVNRYPTGLGKTSGCFDAGLRPLALHAAARRTLAPAA